MPPPPTAHGQAHGPGRGPAEAAPAATGGPPARGGPAGHPKGERGGTGGQQPPLPTRQPRLAAWAGLLPPPGCGQGGAAHCAGRRGRRRLGWPPATPTEREKGGAPPLLRPRTGGQQAPWPRPAAGDAPAALGPPPGRRRRMGGGGRWLGSQKREEEEREKRKKRKRKRKKGKKRIN